MKTNKLILIALILCVSSSVYSLELGTICKQDVFKNDVNGLEVNSFYKIRQKVSLDSNDSLVMSHLQCSIKK